ncbi:protein kinase domain-containing protein [Sorangium sp. So ce341]|uniref:serine/threonine-protein kinase n=1 Tax=Sorangium sp. So ce341 TaxID=3133302 RepID=UPI003F5EB493
MSKSFTHIAAGLVIAEKYKLVRRLGEGSMGVVWAALNLSTSREVALKLIHRPDPELRRRLQREGRNGGALRHGNVIDMYDMGETEFGEPFLVMQLLTGETLAELLQRRRRLDADVAAAIGRDVARGLAAVHAAHIVHRDLKPANIFLHREPDMDEPVVKVLDFGVAKNLSVNDGIRTATGGAVGSPLYMSPEQVRAEPNVDHRADIWALGVVLFEMLTGMRPFQGDARAVFTGILTGEIPKISRYLRRVDPGLVELVARCMARQRDERIGSAAELAELLDGYTAAGARSGGRAGAVVGGGGGVAAPEMPAQRASVAPVSPPVLGASVVPAGLGASVAPAGVPAGLGASVAPAGVPAGLVSSVAPAGVPAALGASVAPAGLGASVAPAGLGASVAPAGLGASVAPAGLGASVAPAGLGASVAPARLPPLPGASGAAEPVWNAELTQKLDPEVMVGADAGAGASPTWGQDEPGRAGRSTPAPGPEAGRAAAQPSPWAARATPPPVPPLEPKRRPARTQVPSAILALVAAFAAGLVGAVLFFALRAPEGSSEVSAGPDASIEAGVERESVESSVAKPAETLAAPAAPAPQAPAAAEPSEIDTDAGAASSAEGAEADASSPPAPSAPAAATTAAAVAAAAPAAAAPAKAAPAVAAPAKAAPTAAAPASRVVAAAQPGGKAPGKTAAPPPPAPQQPAAKRPKVDPCAGKTGFMRTNCLRENERKRDPYAP